MRRLLLDASKKQKSCDVDYQLNFDVYQGTVN